MKGSAFRHTLWVSGPDREPDAAPLTHQMTCDVCGETSDRGVEFGSVRDWQLRHAGRNPSHHSYTETLTRPWRAWMKGPA